MVGLTNINRGALGHLVLDTDESLIDTPAAALFSPCQYRHDLTAECRAWEDVTGEPCRRYRYALTRTWDTTRPAAVFVMLNPSTADAFKLDPTVRRCVRYAQRWQLGGLVVLNAFALRSTDPAGLKTANPIGQDNDQVIASVLSAGVTGPVIVAWGSDETLRRTGRGDAVVALLHAGGIEPQCLGLTKYGYPGHPLYLCGDAEPIRYPNAEAYAVAMNRQES